MAYMINFKYGQVKKKPDRRYKKKEHERKHKIRNKRTFNLALQKIGGQMIIEFLLQTFILCCTKQIEQEPHNMSLLDLTE